MTAESSVLLIEGEKGGGRAKALQGIQMLTADPVQSSAVLGVNVVAPDGKSLDYQKLLDPLVQAKIAEAVARIGQTKDKRETVTGPTDNGFATMQTAPGALYPGFVDPNSGYTYIGPNGTNGRDPAWWQPPSAAQ